MKRILLMCLVLAFFLPGLAFAGNGPTENGKVGNVTAGEIIARAWDYMRGRTSVSVVRMTVHRPDWQRESVIRVWTRGRTDSIFQITSPARDKGNGTLKLGREMWTYNPKINRVVKIPPSMMSQSWMGSDFSNNDLSKADSILEDYTHEIVAISEQEGFTVYTVRALPKPGAPVVWGMQMLTLREDGILLRQAFHDEDMEPVKVLTTQDIRDMGGRKFPRVWIMRALRGDDGENGEDGGRDEYTRLEYERLEFDAGVADRLFTLNALKKPLR